MRDWRNARDFQQEFHFKEVDDKKLPHYMAFADLMIERSAVFSFKALSVERLGVKNVDDALQQLF